MKSFWKSKAEPKPTGQNILAKVEGIAVAASLIFAINSTPTTLIVSLPTQMMRERKRKGFYLPVCTKSLFPTLFPKHCRLLLKGNLDLLGTLAEPFVSGRGISISLVE